MYEFILVKQDIDHPYSIIITAEYEGVKQTIAKYNFITKMGYIKTNDFEKEYKSFKPIINKLGNLYFFMYNESFVKEIEKNAKEYQKKLDQSYNELLLEEIKKEEVNKFN